jgi:lipase chaperone LimK
VPPRTRFQSLLTTLAKEKAMIESQLAKVSDAIAALGGVGKEYQRRQRVRKVKTAARRIVKMTAAQRKAVSQRMKAYWAARRKAAK